MTEYRESKADWDVLDPSDEVQGQQCDWAEAGWQLSPGKGYPP